eukprot:GGOE01004709.1.p1 GENE.GGOE01004709.1~~GGOE01004709.1.p1  ORF type:complete len:2212 (-),score=587.98 GGOE01004709.1:501-7097(-)
MWNVASSEEVKEKLQYAMHAEREAYRFLFELLQQGQHSHLLSSKIHSLDLGKFTLKVHSAHLSQNMRMLWHTDVDFCTTEREYMEIIRVWYVGPVAGVATALSQISTAFSLSRRQLQRLQSLLPKPLPPFEMNGVKVYYPRRVELAKVVPTDIFLMNKFHTVSRCFLDWLSAEQPPEQDFPYRPTQMEHDVITADGNILLLGRSGTGKTLCCIYRICLDMVRSLPDTHLRQVFLTKSKSLCSHARSYFLRIASMEASISDEPRSCAPPRKLEDFAACHFPLFLPLRQFLFLLDSACPQPFFPRDARGLPTTLAGRRFAAEGGVLDEAFAEFEACQVKDRCSLQEVTFETFASTMWPRMLALLGDRTKAAWLDAPILVWTELMTFIEGSYAALNNPDCPAITQKAYCDLGRKQAIALQDHRETVWQLYELYKKQKKATNQFDMPDVVHHVFHQLAKRPLSRSFDFLYVDEVQDVTQAEARLLLAVCQNRRSGFFLAGDTCQTVSKGIDFRFCDLHSSFLYEQKEQERAGQCTGDISTNDDTTEEGNAKSNEATSSTTVGLGRKRKNLLALPKQMKLIYNYRSHAGIIALGNTCIHMLEELFPNSIDKLEKDVGLQFGPYAMAFADAPFSVFLQQLPGPVGEQSAGHQAVPQFGHRQAFLVRNAAAKVGIQGALGGHLVQVFTIEEAKGLEFEVVFLVDFFRDSPYSNWKVLNKVSATRDTPHWLRECLEANSASFPFSLAHPAADIHAQQLAARLEELSTTRVASNVSFDMQNDFLLCNELKQLYTAITRTRNSLVVFESDCTNALPMLLFWRSQRLIHLSLHESDASRRRLRENMLASTPAEWSQRGQELMNINQYTRAKQCFEFAGNQLLRDTAHAFETLEEAKAVEKQRLPATEGKAIQLHAEAARQFRDLGLLEEAVAAYLGARQYGVAGELLVELRDWKRAADVLLEAGQHRLALETCMDGDEAAKLLEILQKPQCPSRAAHEFLVQHYVWEGFTQDDRGEVLAWLKRSGRQATADAICTAVADWWQGHNQTMYAALLCRQQKQHRKAAALFEESRLWFEAGACWSDASHPAKAYAAFCEAGEDTEAVLSSDHITSQDVQAALQQVHLTFDTGARPLAGDKLLQRQALALHRAGGLAPEAGGERCRHYFDAAHCFERLEAALKEEGRQLSAALRAVYGEVLEKLERYSEAVQHYVKASCWLQAGDLQEKIGDHENAATSFESGQYWNKAAQCWKQVGQWRPAAIALTKAQHFTDAAKCWEAANEHVRAAEAYQVAKEWWEAARSWKKAKRYVEAVAALLEAKAPKEALQVCTQNCLHNELLAVLKRCLPQAVAEFLETQFLKAEFPKDIRSAIVSWLVGKDAGSAKALYSAVACHWRDTGDHAAAAFLFCKTNDWQSAAESSKAASMWLDAGKAYLKAGDAASAHQVFLRGTTDPTVQLAGTVTNAALHDAISKLEARVAFWLRKVDATLPLKAVAFRWAGQTAPTPAETQRCCTEAVTSFQCMEDQGLLLKNHRKEWGWCLAALGDVEGALHQYSAADLKVDAALLLEKKERWAEAAPLFQAKGVWKNAAHCWAKAEKPVEAAKACEWAGNMAQAAGHWRRAGDYQRAATLYEKVANSFAAAECWGLLGEFSASAKLYESVRNPFLAGQMWEQAQEWTNAIRCFEAAEDYGNAVRLHKLHSPRATLLATAQEYVCWKETFRYGGEMLQGMGMTKEALDIYCRWEAWAEAAQALEEMGHHLKAGQCWDKAKQGLEAARAYEKGKDFVTAAQRWTALQEFAAAAQAYEKASRLKYAAEFWEKAQDYANAIRCFERNSAFSMAARLHKQHSDHATIQTAAAKYASQRRSFQVGAELFDHLREFDREVETFERWGAWADAVRVIIRTGDVGQAAMLLERQPPTSNINEKDLRLALEVCVDAHWCRFPSFLAVLQPWTALSLEVSNFFASLPLDGQQRFINCLFSTFDAWPAETSKFFVNAVVEHVKETFLDATVWPDDLPGLREVCCWLEECQQNHRPPPRPILPLSLHDAFRGSNRIGYCLLWQVADSWHTCGRDLAFVCQTLENVLEEKSTLMSDPVMCGLLVRLIRFPKVLPAQDSLQGLLDLAVAQVSAENLPLVLAVGFTCLAWWVPCSPPVLHVKVLGGLRNVPLGSALSVDNAKALIRGNNPFATPSPWAKCTEPCADGWTRAKSRRRKK